MYDFYTLDDNDNPVGHYFADREDVTYQKAFGNRWQLKDTIGDYFVSTVFLSLDYGSGYGIPVLFETIVFKDDYDTIDMMRYTRKSFAIEGHKKAVEWVKNGCVGDLESWGDDE